MTRLRIEAQEAEEDLIFDSDSLIRLYESMYKYEWLQMYSKSDAMSIEPELKSLLAEGIEYLKKTFEKWLQEHVLPGWWETRFVDGGEDPFLYAINGLGSAQWGFGHSPIIDILEVYDWIFSHVNREKMIYDEFNNDMSYFESYAIPFLESKELDVENMNESDAITYIDNNQLHEEFKNFLISETSAFTAEEMRDIYGDSIEYILENPFFYGILKENEDEFINWAYQKFITFFSLEPIIDGVRSALEYMESADVNSIPEAIAAFNKGLTTAHYSGDMSQHFVDFMGGEGSDITNKLLKELSDGIYNKQWDYELKKMGIPIGAKKRVLNTCGELR